MELTRKQAIDLTKRHWRWCAKTGKGKTEWPRLKKLILTRTINTCFLCEYSLQEGSTAETDVIKGSVGCPCCPYSEKFGTCYSADKPYIKWSMARTLEERKQYAQMFLAQLDQL